MKNNENTVIIIWLKCYPTSLIVFLLLNKINLDSLKNWKRGGSLRYKKKISFMSTIHSWVIVTIKFRENFHDISEIFRFFTWMFPAGWSKELIISFNGEMKICSRCDTKLFLLGFHQLQFHHSFWKSCYYHSILKGLEAIHNFLFFFNQKNLKDVQLFYLLIAFCKIQQDHQYYTAV